MILFIENQLNTLRTKIKQLDQDIVSLISQRIAVAKEIGTIKVSQGLPIRNFQVEKQVYTRVGEFARDQGVDTKHITSIFKSIVSSSIDAQTHDRLNSKRVHSDKRCLLIGGSGKMGSWFSKFFYTTGYQVDIVDREEPQEGFNSHFTSLPASLEPYEIIGICTPMNSTRQILTEVIELRPSGLVFDILSLKSDILDLIQSAIGYGLNYISIHPMFGADVPDLFNRKVIVCNLDANTRIEGFIEIFEDTSVTLVNIPLEEHDKMMMYILGLSHFVNLLMGDVLSQSGYSMSHITNFEGTTFTKQISTTMEVFDENPELYYFIQEKNLFKEDLFQSIRFSMRNLIASIENGDLVNFVENMRNINEFFKS